MALISRILITALCLSSIACTSTGTRKAYALVEVTGAGSTRAETDNVVCAPSADPRQQLATIRWGKDDFKGTVYLRLGTDGAIDYFDLSFGHVREERGGDLLGRDVTFEAYDDAVSVVVDRDPRIVVDSGATTRAGRLTFTGLEAVVTPELNPRPSSEISGEVQWSCP